MSDKRRAQLAGKTARIRKRNKRIVSAVLFFVLFAAVLSSLLFVPFFNITSVSCTGTAILDEKTVIDASGVVLGVNIFRIPVNRIEENVEEALPYVADVTVRRSFPSAVSLEVVERIPVAYIKNGASYLVIDEAGTALETTDSLNARGVLPLIPELKLDKEKELLLGKPIAVTDAYRLKELLRCISEIAKKSNLNGRVTKLSVNDLMQYELVIEDRIQAIIPVDSDLDYQLDFMLAALAQQSPTIEGEIDLTIEGKAAFRPKTQEVVKVNTEESNDDVTEEIVGESTEAPATVEEDLTEPEGLPEDVQE